MPRRMSRLRELRDVKGFDGTTHIPGTSRYRVRCSQCEALVINGIPAHESGCPNIPRFNDRDDDPDEC